MAEESLNESPSKKEGKYRARLWSEVYLQDASMKAPPRRKGNHNPGEDAAQLAPCLNESPSKKEGKYAIRD